MTFTWANKKNNLRRIRKRSHHRSNKAGPSSDCLPPRKQSEVLRRYLSNHKSCPLTSTSASPRWIQVTNPNGLVGFANTSSIHILCALGKRYADRCCTYSNSIRRLTSSPRQWYLLSMAAWIRSTLRWPPWGESWLTRRISYFGAWTGGTYTAPRLSGWRFRHWRGSQSFNACLWSLGCMFRPE